MTRSSRSIDVSVFDDIVAAAAAAFEEDVSYAVAMIKQAKAIAHKRKVWAARLELRKAEETARNKCSNSEAFWCRTQSPCGTGTCKFAEGDLADLNVPYVEGKRDRPQQSLTGPYDLESAVIPLHDKRKAED